MAEEEKASVEVLNRIESEYLKSNETSGSLFYQLKTESSKEIERLKLDNYKLSKANEDLKMANVEITVKLTKKINKIQDLKKELSEYHNKLSSAEVKIQQLSSDSPHQNSGQLEEVYQEKYKLVKKLSLHTESITKLMNERDQMSEQYQQYTNKYIQQLSQQVTSLQDEVKQLSQEKEDLTKERNSLKEISENQNNKMTNSCDESSELKLQINILTQKNEEVTQSFQDEWVEYREPLEIELSGRYIMSDTEKGKSIIFYHHNFFEQDKASELMDHLLNTTNWHSKNVTIRGIEYPQPRLVAWYGPFPYSYSGMTLEAAEMPYCISKIKKKIEKYLQVNGVNAKLNSVLLNRYRNNRDSVGWHSDDETSMGICPTIASVSLGEIRRFEMRRKLKYFKGESSYTEHDEYFIRLNNGSLLIMDGSMQEDWQHRVPKETQPKHERINLTFRMVLKVQNFLRSPKAPFKRGVTKIHRKKISFGKTVNTDAKSECSVTECSKPEENPKSQLKVGHQICEDAETKRSLMYITKTSRENISFGKTVDADKESVCSVSESNKPEDKNPKSSFKRDNQICVDSESKTSFWQVTKTHREKISFGKTVDADAEPECSVTESNKSEKKNHISSFKLDNQISEDAETKRFFRQVTKAHREKMTVECDAKSKGFDTVCKTEDFKTITKSKKPEEKNLEPSFKVEDKTWEDTETNAYKYLTLKAEEKLKESDEKEDIVDLSFRKRKTKLDVKNGVKNIDNTDAITGKNKRFCISAQSITTYSLNNTVQNDFKIQNENTCNADNNCENYKFDSCELKDLLNYNVNLMNCDLFRNYANVLKNRILQNINEFKLPEKMELEVLCELMNGHLMEEHKKILTKRMCFVANRALKLPEGNSKTC